MNKPVVLCILDGCGIREESDGNAFKNATKPTLDMLFNKYPHSILQASGPSVGLPEGQMGTSEVGHMNLGSGRVALQPLQAITKSIDDGTLFENENILDMLIRGKICSSKREAREMVSAGAISINGNKETNLDKTTAKIDEIIYPMYLPKNTTLTSQDRVSLPSGERVILTFKGDKPFTFIQETISVDDELTTVLSYGEPTLLCDSVASLSSNSITWISNGVEYYIVSDALSEQELTEIAVSISSIPVMK